MKLPNRRSLVLLALACGLCAVWLSASAVAQSTGSGSDKALGVTPVSAAEVREAVNALPADLRVPDRHALILGVGQYTDRRVSSLPACVNDARGLYEVLTDPSVGMFPEANVTLLVDEQVTRGAVVDALDQLARRAGKEDLVVVFFSGHGAVDVASRSYWVMHDTQIDKLRATGLPESEITELLGDVKTSRLVTLIDACFSASTAQLGDSKSILDVRKIYPSFDGKGRVAITASSGDQLSVVIPEGQAGHGYSAFAYHLIQGLKGSADGASGGNREGVITVDELWDYVKDRTSATARRAGGRQQPQLKGQLGSRFLLTVNSQQLVAANKGTKERLAALQELFLEDKISPLQFRQGKRLLSANPTLLDGQDRERREVYADLSEGRLGSAFLADALSRTTAHMESQAVEENRQIQVLLVKAKVRDNKKHGRQALKYLDEVLRIHPHHVEAAMLRNKISAYYKKPKAGSLWTNKKGITFAYVPSGHYLMGSPDDEYLRDDDEGQRRVKITSGFWMGVVEVTQEQWVDVMGTDPSKAKGDKLPVEMVSWDEAIAFCKALSLIDGRNYRLPTEAEWEYVCRAGTYGPFSFGNTIDRGKANYNSYFAYAEGVDKRPRSESFSKLGTVDVANHPPNAWGVFDMHGNVREWCVSNYNHSNMIKLETDDQRRVASGERKVVRGGGWNSAPQFCRSASREGLAPSYKYVDVGFRICIDYE